LAKDALSRGVRAVFEVGNEPDLGDSYFAKHGGQAAYIARFIEHANAIHTAAPGSEVYGPALCGLGATAPFWQLGIRVGSMLSWQKPATKPTAPVEVQ
jgi:hypothetical protein